MNNDIKFFDHFYIVLIHGCLHIRVWFCRTGNNSLPGASPRWPPSASGRTLAWINICNFSCFTESDTIERFQSWNKRITIQTLEVTIILNAVQKLFKSWSFY